ncbi:molybdenum cofactor guanylyltransferase [Microbacterium sp. bgisy189]|uniref:molybdenum cofactor guanylyltransferase n=1 Tax=Microbacterium sp. bgisy189 TaxID=3413798 RepID=UPI003EBBC055
MTAAILLAGGRARRLDGEVKPLLEVAGRSLLATAVDAVTGCDPIVVVGPVLDFDLPVRWAREEPAFGGPAAAVVAGVDALGATDAEWTVVLACDLPGAPEAVARLLRDLALLPADADGVCLADESSRPQWLTAIYRTAALRRAASAMADGGAGASMRDLLADLAITVLAAPAAETADVDTWEDLKQARLRAAPGSESS